MTRQPITALARLTAAWTSPANERRVYWRTLISRDNWAVLLITKGQPGEPPEPPLHIPATRINPSWVRRTGGTLTPEQLIHERIGQHLHAYAQNTTQIDLISAASLATAAAVEALAELGVDITTLTRGDDQEANG